MMLLAPKTRWAMVNLSGSVGGKYGANTHRSTHLRRRILQAAQGVRMTCGGEGGAELAGDPPPLTAEDVGEEGEDVSCEVVGVVVLLLSVLYPISVVVAAGSG